MAVLKARQEQRTYLTIGAAGDGKTYLKQQVEEGTINAIKREWSVNGESGTKYELCFPSVEGMVTGIEFKEKDFGGKKHFDIYLTFDNEIVVTAKSTSRFGTSIMRQLPAVDLSQPLSLSPYSYIPKGKTKESTGVSMKQGVGFTDKISDYFYDFENKKSLNGIPESDFDWATAEEWQTKKFWGDVDTFLRNYITENVLVNLPKVEEVAVEATDEPEVDAEQGGLEDTFTADDF